MIHFLVLYCHPWAGTTPISNKLSIIPNMAIINPSHGNGSYSCHVLLFFFLPGTQLKFSQMGVLHERLAHRVLWLNVEKKKWQIFPNGKKRSGVCLLSLNISSLKAFLLLRCVAFAQRNSCRSERSFFNWDVKPVYFTMLVFVFTIVYSYMRPVFDIWQRWHLCQHSSVSIIDVCCCLRSTMTSFIFLENPILKYAIWKVY